MALPPRAHGSPESPGDTPEGRGTIGAPPPPGTLREDGAEQVLDLIRPAARVGGQGVNWRELFDANDPRELLARLAESDDLSLRDRSIAYLQKRSLALHVDRLHIRSLARVAFQGLLYTGRPALEPWLDKLIAQGARELIQRDLEAEIARQPIDALDEVSYRFLIEVFGVHPPLARRLGVRFNLLGEETRQVLWRTALQGQPVESLGEQGLERLKQGLEAVSRPAPLVPADLLELDAALGEER